MKTLEQDEDDIVIREYSIYSDYEMAIETLVAFYFYGPRLRFGPIGTHVHWPLKNCITLHYVSQTLKFS